MPNPCPKCGAEMLDDTVTEWPFPTAIRRCPHCLYWEEWIAAEGSLFGESDGYWKGYYPQPDGTIVAVGYAPEEGKG